MTRAFFQNVEYYTHHSPIFNKKKNS